MVFDMASHFYSNVGNAQVPSRIEKYMGSAFLSATSFSSVEVKLTIWGTREKKDLLKSYFLVVLEEGGTIF